MLRPCYLNQKQEEMFHRYCNSCATSLYDVYESWSDKKDEAYKYCLRDMKEHDGYDMRITGANGFAFSCAFLVNIGDDWQTMDDCPYTVISNIYDNKEE